MRFERAPLRPHLLALFAFVALLFLGPDAHAHQAGLSRGEYTLAGREIDLHIVFANSEVSAAVPMLDKDHDGHLSTDEVEASRADIFSLFIAPLSIRADGEVCTSKLEDARIESADGLLVVAKYTCPKVPKHLRIEAGFLDRFDFTHRHIAEIVSGSRVEERVAVPANRVIDVDVQATEGAPPPESSVFVPLFKMGIFHILTGYDHLMFLFGLVLVGGRKRALVALVTAFTVAHSISLALAVLHVFEPPAYIIEPAIALSIAYVGVENFFVKNAEHRWKITFPFGLIHGFGFAAALQEIALPHAQVPVALFAFNIGVETGQLAVLAVLLPLLHFARKSAWFRDKGVKGLSLVVASAGMIWFVTRVARAIHSGA